MNEHLAWSEAIYAKRMSIEPIPDALEALPLALLLEVDGTVLDLADAPGLVRVGPETLDLLRLLNLRTNGAVGLVSGRQIADLDALFAPLLLPCAGLYGFERRTARGRYYRCCLPSGSLVQRVREALYRLASLHEGLLVEDKRFVIGLHYRRAPQLARIVIEAARKIAVRVQPELVLQVGRLQVEFRPAACDKGSAAAHLLEGEPFRGRFPIYLGSDVADEIAFERINTLGGISVAVGVRRPTAARTTLPDVATARDWLRALPDSLMNLAVSRRSESQARRETLYGTEVR